MCSDCATNRRARSRSGSPLRKSEFDEYEKNYSKQLLTKEIQKVKELEQKLQEKDNELAIAESLRTLNQQLIEKNKALVQQAKDLEQEIKSDYKNE